MAAGLLGKWIVILPIGIPHPIEEGRLLGGSEP